MTNATDTINISLTLFALTNIIMELEARASQLEEWAKEPLPVHGSKTCSPAVAARIARDRQNDCRKQAALVREDARSLRDQLPEDWR